MPLLACLIMLHHLFLFFFFFNGTAPTEIYTLSLHDALPICAGIGQRRPNHHWLPGTQERARTRTDATGLRSYLRGLPRLIFFIARRHEPARHRRVSLTGLPAPGALRRSVGLAGKVGGAEIGRAHV